MLTVCSASCAATLFGSSCVSVVLRSSQLFRRVAAALPGMDSTPEKSKEDSILFLCALSIQIIDIAVVTVNVSITTFDLKRLKSRSLLANE